MYVCIYIYRYANSLLKYAEGGYNFPIFTSCRCHVSVLSKWVPDTWVVWFQIAAWAFQCAILQRSYSHHHWSRSHIASDQRSQPITDTSIARDPSERAVFGLPIAIRSRFADLGFSGHFPIALRGSTQTVTIIGTLGCANVFSTNSPRQKTPDRAIRFFLRSRSWSQLRSRNLVH